MIQAVYDVGRPQYFIVGAPDVQSIINRPAPDAGLKLVGTYAAFGSAPIYKLVNVRTKLPCS